MRKKSSFLVMSFFGLFMSLFSGCICFAATQGENILADKIFPVDEFSIDGRKVGAWQSLPKEHVEISGDKNAARLSERTNRLCIKGAREDLGDLVLVRSVIQSADDSYVRYIFSITAKDKPVMINEISFLKDFAGKVSGNTDGSVVYTENKFLGVEHPMAKISEKPFLVEKWTPADFKAVEQTIEVKTPFAANDVISVTFNYEKGPDRIDIAAVKLFDGAVCVATDEHEGFAGVKESKNVYSLPVANEVKNPRLAVVYKSMPRTDSFGKITVASKNNPGRVSAVLKRNFELGKNETWEFSVVEGKYSQGQMRRDFQSYLNRERAHPYRVFPHYNSWYHLGLQNEKFEDPMKRLTDAKALKAMKDFNAELFVKRGVSIDSYLWDDGWDEWNSLWDYHKGFPQGFKHLAEQAKRQKSGIGAWLSPWGGYNKAKPKRVAFAKKMGLPVNAGGLSLAQPKYFEAFNNRCVQMIRDYNVNLFKFDGIGGGVYAKGVSDAFSADVQGLLRHIAILRKEKPDVFVNCTVGTWASPFWLRHADSIWRGGSDWGTAGVAGLKRERWITFRDDVIYSRFVKPCPLFPLNSIMSHGIIVSEIFGMAVDDSVESTTAFANEVWMGIACGADLQEYYISPEKMSSKWWDILADGIKWLRKNENVLRDSHWLGGKPANGEIYGYASFSPKKQIIVIRNPSKETKTWQGSIDEALECPEGFTVNKKSAKVVYSSVNDKKAFSENGISLAPFEVKLIEFTK